VDDVRLVERMREGDESAFAAAFAAHRGVIHRYASHMGGAATADDVVQETFLALIRQLDRYDASRGSLQAYLLGIARHLLLKRMAIAAPDDVSGRSIDGEGGPFAASDENPLEQLTRAEAVGRVRAAIRELPAAYREVVVLCGLNDLDYAAAAAAIGCPIGTVRSRLHRARALLAAMLDERSPVQAAIRRAAGGKG
jgi:RNA polymerase sigma-70 factor, ECF subfamily